VGGGGARPPEEPEALLLAVLAVQHVCARVCRCHAPSRMRGPRQLWTQVVTRAAKQTVRRRQLQTGAACWLRAVLSSEQARRTQERGKMDTERGESSLLTLIGHLDTQSVKDARNVSLAQTHNSPRLNSVHA
jgi:hypothetical protein